MERIDFQMTQSACPDIMIRDNDVFFDADCIAGRPVSLATMICNRGLAQHVIITRLMPRFGTPRCLLDRETQREDRIGI